jgi:hypothetical protein
MALTAKFGLMIWAANPRHGSERAAAIRAGKIAVLIDLPEVTPIPQIDQRGEGILAQCSAEFRANLRDRAKPASRAVCSPPIL